MATAGVHHQHYRTERLRRKRSHQHPAAMEPGPGPEEEPEPEQGGPAVSVAPAPAASIKKNSVGGVNVTDKEIQLAFSFLDVKGKGSVTRAGVQERLGVFPSMQPAELRGLESDLTQKSLAKMLKGNQVVDFDPVAEAFAMFDPHGTGKVDIGAVREVFRNMGMGELTSDEVALIRKSGGNPSGYITLEDFRGMLPQ